jgi:hypothetical protein
MCNDDCGCVKCEKFLYGTLLDDLEVELDFTDSWSFLDEQEDDKSVAAPVRSALEMFYGFTEADDADVSVYEHWRESAAGDTEW